MNSRYKIQILGALLFLLLIGQTVFAAGGGGWNNWSDQSWSEWSDEVDTEWEGGDGVNNGWGGDSEDSIHRVQWNGRFPPNRYWQCTSVNRRNVPFVGNGRTRWEAEQNSLRDCYGQRSRFCTVYNCRVI